MIPDNLWANCSLGNMNYMVDKEHNCIVNYPMEKHHLGVSMLSIVWVLSGSCQDVSFKGAFSLSWLINIVFIFYMIHCHQQIMTTSLRKIFCCLGMFWVYVQLRVASIYFILLLTLFVGWQKRYMSLPIRIWVLIWWGEQKIWYTQPSCRLKPIVS